jgi:hypothetical protein
VTRGFTDAEVEAASARVREAIQRVVDDDLWDEVNSLMGDAGWEPDDEGAEDVETLLWQRVWDGAMEPFVLSSGRDFPPSP